MSVETAAHFNIHKLSTLWNENKLKIQNLCFHMTGHNLCIALMYIVALRTINVLTVNWINGSYVRKRIPSVPLQGVYGPVTGRLLARY